MAPRQGRKEGREGEKVYKIDSNSFSFDISKEFENSAHSWPSE